jgi:exodeoxyribonuclease V gamma subunit
MHPGITPGLLILHGNQMEQLRAAVFQWLRNHPLGALERKSSWCSRTAWPNG